MRVRWTEPAARDLTGICDYTQEHHGPEAARSELVLSGSSFLAIYRVRKDVIEIARILHGAQRWP